MANVLVEEEYLIRIAESLRRAKGETKIVIVPTDVPVPLTKYSSTPNATGFGAYSGGYGDNKALFDTVTIPGAAQLQVKVQTQTENTNYDWLYIVEGEVSSMPSSGTKYGGSALSTRTLTFTGDTITFCFRSDSGVSNYLGYYAEITGFDADGNVIGTGETVTEYIPTEVPNIFRPCDMALAENERIYYVGTATSVLSNEILNFESSAIGELTE